MRADIVRFCGCCLKFEGNGASHSEVHSKRLTVTNKGRMPYQKKEI